MIDSHLHVWDLEAGEYPWLGPQHGALYATYTPEMAREVISVAGLDAAILVQAEDTERETLAMLDIAGEYEFVAGVVGWLRLDSPETAASQLDTYGRRAGFCGVRHLVHEDPRDEFLRMPDVRTSLRRLADAGLAFDVPDAWPRHLSGVADLAAELPELTVVVDHLGKPPRGRGDFAEWEETLRVVASRPNTVAKLSGLQAAGEPMTTSALRPVWEVALETFGPERLMYGGDWPMTVPCGGYATVWGVVAQLIAELSTAEQSCILDDTARRVYRIERGQPVDRRHTPGVPC